MIGIAYWCYWTLPRNRIISESRTKTCRLVIEKIYTGSVSTCKMSNCYIPKSTLQRHLLISHNGSSTSFRLNYFLSGLCNIGLLSGSLPEATYITGGKTTKCGISHTRDVYWWWVRGISPTPPGDLIPFILLPRELSSWMWNLQWDMAPSLYTQGQIESGSLASIRHSKNQLPIESGE